MVLTNEERERFRNYCKIAQESCRAIADQMKTIGIPEELIAMERRKQAAYNIVEHDLNRVETQELTHDVEV